MKNWVETNSNLMKKQIVISVSFSGAVSDCRHVLKPEIISCSHFAETINQSVGIQDEK